MVRYLSLMLTSGLRATLVALSVTCAACGSLAAQASPPPPAPALDGAENGAILERVPCQATDSRDLSAALDTYYREDILKAQLADELAAHPLTSIFTEDENRSLAAAAGDGRCERVIYRSSGLRVAGFVLRPAAPGPHPVLIWLRGGNREFGKIEPVTLLNLLWLADAGFVVVATQYRGVDGGQGADEFGGADVDDVLALVPLARSLPDADVERLYLLGGSRGGMEGALAMRRGLPVRAAAFRGGLYDLKATRAYRPVFAATWKEMIPDHATGFDEALDGRSAVLWADALRAPILLLHGRQDWRERVAGAQAFDAALAKAGVEHKLVIYERDEHQLALHRTEWLTEVVTWFRDHGAFEIHNPSKP